LPQQTLFLVEGVEKMMTENTISGFVGARVGSGAVFLVRGNQSLKND
jgi:hypothetical protein